MIKKKRILIAASALILLAIAANTAPLWLSKSPSFINPSQRLLAPSADYWFGTDHFGRDIFTRTIYGARVSLFIGFVVAMSSIILGTITGLLSGFYKKSDFLIMRIIDGMLAFPGLVLALALVAALGGNAFNIIIAMTFSIFPAVARIVRSAVLQVTPLQYIEAARITGTSDMVIILRYILPNVLSPIIVQGTFIFAKVILAEAALSFIGIGVSPDIPTWGNMIQEAQVFISTAPWFSIFPGIAIVIIVLTLNMLGDGIRDALDPHSSMKKGSRKSKKLKSA